MSENYQSACPWDIYSLPLADEKVGWRTEWPEHYARAHRRIARVPTTCATFSRTDCAAMQAPSDPELMETLNSLSETEPIDTLRCALDQMRHFLWFYSQVMDNDPELGDKLRQSANAKSHDGREAEIRNFFPRSTLPRRRTRVTAAPGGIQRRKPN